MTNLLRAGALLSGLVVLAFIIFQTDPSLIAEVVRTGFALCLLGTLVATVRTVIGTYGLVVLIRGQSTEGRLPLLVDILQASIVNLSIPFLGFALKARSLKRKQHLDYKASVGILAIFTGTRVISASSIILIALVADHLGNFWLAAVIVPAWFAFLFTFGQVLSKSSKFAGTLKAHLKNLPILYGLDLATILNSAIVISLLTSAFGVSIGPETALISAAAAMLASAIPLLPGGLGFREAAIVAALYSIGQKLSWLASVAILERVISVIGRILAFTTVLALERLLRPRETI